MSISESLFKRAAECIPGGVNSPVRAWGAVGGHPVFIERARGSHVCDVEGREYVDYVGSWGPMILGHAHEQVVEAVHGALRNGTSFGAPTALEVDLAERLKAVIPSLDLVRLVSSGTEATMTAIRLARGATGRSKILKFSGCYHGHVDALLVRAGSGAATFGVPDSAGVPEAVASHTLVANYNDLGSVRAYCDAEGENIAAIIVEPVVGNMGVIPPADGFLPGLRKLADDIGACLIFDEVITGFRLRYGAVQDKFGVRPDLTCLGKIVGGGLPLAAFGGRRELMQKLAPLGPVYQAGTLSGNPLAVAAGLRTLELLGREGFYDTLDGRAACLEAGLQEALSAWDGTACINRVGSMWTLFFGVPEVRCPDDARRCNTELYGRWFRGMLDGGIYLPPSQFEAAFVSDAHADGDIEATVRAARQVLASLA